MLFIARVKVIGLPRFLLVGCYLHKQFLFNVIHFVHDLVPLFLFQIAPIVSEQLVMQEYVELRLNEEETLLLHG